MPVVRVLVQGDLAVQRQDRAVRGEDEWIHLDQGGILGNHHVPEVDQDVRDLIGDRLAEPRSLDDLPGLFRGHPLQGIDANPRQGLGLGCRDLLDIHSALDTGHRQEGAIRTIEQEGDVVLLGNIAGGGDEHLAHYVALDIEPEDRLRSSRDFVISAAQLYAPRLATSARVNLRLYRPMRTTQFGGDIHRLVWAVSDTTRRHADAKA